jgi:trk system potassium uptake protein TrkA
MTSERKRICIAGLGQFGGELARNLCRNCDVLALDVEESRVNDFADVVQRALILDVRDGDALREVVDADFDEAVVALGSRLDASVLATLHLKNIGVPVLRAKALSPDHAEILRAVGATHVVYPERETARRLAAQIANPNLLDFIPVAEDYLAVEVAAPTAYHGRSLLDLELRSRFGVFVIGVREKDPEKFILLPGPGFVVKPSDVLLVIGHRRGVESMQAVPAEGERRGPLESPGANG